MKLTLVTRLALCCLTAQAAAASIKTHEHVRGELKHFAGMGISSDFGFGSNRSNTSKRSGDSRSHNLARARGREHRATSFLTTLNFKHILRVCNAYPYSGAIDVYQGKVRITDNPMPYKTCKEFKAPLRQGDKLLFKVGDASAGSFSVSDLPSHDAVLVLVIYRHDTLSTAVSFESHVFANLINAQIAVLDTYRGTRKGEPKIQDAHGAKTARKEELRYDSVVAVNPGLYEVVLEDQNDASKTVQNELVALNRESYVIIRCGVESEEGEAYPQELMIFPHSSKEALNGRARRAYGSAFALIVGFLMTLIQS